ncbi:molybdopterin molybdotransferase MoeA [Desulforhopalus sp. 52FAK]
MLNKKNRATDEAVISAQLLLREIQSFCAKRNPGPKNTEVTPLENAAGRVLADEVSAGCDAPLYDESLRDGYAIGPLDIDAVQSASTFTLVGETGAGDSLALNLGAGQTWKVMTGGKVPGNCSCVIPQELCRISGDLITIDRAHLTGPTFVRRKGSHHKTGDTLVATGTVISPAILVTIADAGRTDVNIYSQPRVCFCCTGKELVGAGVVPGDAQKISSNQYLLAALIKQYGCKADNYGIVGDEESLVADFFNYSLGDNYDLVLTTGGTGGGDFDLVERGFIGAGGTVTCNSLKMRPGKSTVIGFKGKTVYIGLPGPPAAAHTVFLEIVVPLLMQMKGVENVSNSVVSAVATEEIKVKTKGSLVVKEGVSCLSQGVLQVRMAGKKEFATCNVLIPPGKDYIARGEPVEIHMREPLFFNR